MKSVRTLTGCSELIIFFKASVLPQWRLERGNLRDVVEEVPLDHGYRFRPNKASSGSASTKRCMAPGRDPTHRNMTATPDESYVSSSTN